MGLAARMYAPAPEFAASVAGVARSRSSRGGRELVALSLDAPHHVRRGYAHKFYARNVSTEPEESKLRDFADRCPPFLMMVMAAVKAQYERAIVEKPKGRKRAGRLDLLMSIYLPYCRVFVTHDDDQEACLREMATLANLEAEILSYRDFSGRLLGTAIAV